MAHYTSKDTDEMDRVYRVAIHPSQESVLRGETAVEYQGPYYKRGTAKGQVTANRTDAKRWRNRVIDYNNSLGPNEVARPVESDAEIEARIYLEYVKGPWKRWV